MCKIKMAGIDHKKASVEYRELFAMTKKECAKALEFLKKQEGISGCVIISTCNRMEIWLSCSSELLKNPDEILCELKGLNYSRFKEFFTIREGKEAVSNLFETACGLNSKVFGEDQIITQVKDSLSFARENYATDNVLEVLFRKAITAAKKVKTNIRLTSASSSVMEQIMPCIMEGKTSLEGKKCLIIGNGEMGRIAAQAFLNEKADVTVTIRQYRSGIVNVPTECRRVNYSERFNDISNYDFVISATASPNFTIKKEELENITFDKKVYFIDLAVPRDIEPLVADINNIDLYDIDSFNIEGNDEKILKDIGMAKEILNKYEDEFYTWYECRDLVSKVEEIGNLASNEVMGRIAGTIKGVNPITQKEEYDLKIETAVKKTVDKLVFELRDNLEIDEFRKCIYILESIWETGE